MNQIQHDRHVGDWFVADVEAWLRGLLDTDRLLAIAWRIGAATADLHTMSSGSQRSTIGVRTYFVEAMAALGEALSVVDGPQRTRLRLREAAVREALEPLRSDRLLSAHRVHGDLTVGRFHAVEGDLSIDLREPVDEWAPDLPQSPLIDLATLLQSLDHGCRMAAHIKGRAETDETSRLVVLLEDAVLDAYGVVHVVDAQVLRALRVLVELRHAAWLSGPRSAWAWLPDEAMPGLLSRAAR